MSTASFDVPATGHVNTIIIAFDFVFDARCCQGGM
jgi:hypothetical protein